MNIESMPETHRDQRLQAALDVVDLNRIDADIQLRRLLGEQNPQPLLWGSDIFNSYYPGKWPQGQKLLRPINHEDLQTIKRSCRLDEIESMFEGTNRFATLDQRAYVWLAARGKCSYCDMNVSPIYMQSDHIVPFSMGGKTTLENLACSCVKCNIAKNQEDPVAFLDFMSGDGKFRRRDLLYRYRKYDYGPQKPNHDEIVEAFDALYPADQ